MDTSGAVLLGLGAIVGTGVYVSIGLAAGIAGAAIVPALLLAALLALCNGLSSAQLAVNHPVSGGTYEYGYRYLNHWLGFTAGWLFLIAKGASAAAAALGFTAYLRALLGIDSVWQTPLALLLVAAVTGVVLIGLRVTARLNGVLVTVTVGALLLFVIAALPTAWNGRARVAAGLVPASGREMGDLLHAAALMFVAFTGYGRVATLGEEVVEPRRTIPRAILWTVAASGGLYIAVALAAVGASSSEQLAAAARAGLPLSWLLQQLGKPVVALIVSAGAVVAMAGVLLNLVLGLSRVVLAMARRRDLPARLATLNTASTSAPAAVIIVGLGVTLAVTMGDIRSTWSFSALSVLLYYAITNLAALRIAPNERFVPRAVSLLGLGGCLALAGFIEGWVWLYGITLLIAGLLVHMLVVHVLVRSHRSLGP